MLNSVYYVKENSMSNKPCKWCHQTKPLDEFPKHSQMTDGHINRCKSCCNEWSNKYRQRPDVKEKRKEEKQYLDNKKRYKQSEKGRAAAKKYKRDSVRESAKNAVAYAVRQGYLKKQPCFVCGDKGLAHHASYADDMKLMVTWLCVHHHNQLHNDHKGYKSWS